MAVDAGAPGEFDQKMLSTHEKVAYASGNLPGAFFGSFTGQIQAFYYGWMGLNWIYIVIGQIFYGIWNFVNDPVFGYLQDRTRSKRGRYLPWIKWCSPVFTVAFILLFVPPAAWRLNVGGAQFQLVLFLWYLVTQVVYDTFFTIVYLAHVALQAQMTMNLEERTELAIMNAIFWAIGLGLSAYFPLQYLTDPTADKIQTLQVLVIVFGIVGFLPWPWIWKAVRERQEFIPAEETPLLEGIKCVLRNPSGRIYMLYDGLSVGITNFLFTGITFFVTWVLGQNSIYQAAHPGWDVFSLVPYLIGPLVGLLAGIYIELQIPKKYDLKTALMYSLVMEAVGFFVAFLGAVPDLSVPADSYQLPPHLWLLSVGLTIALMGFPGDFLYHNPMRADTIDYDEYMTGERRESVYAGVGCFLSKPMISVALATVPAVMAAFGLVPVPQGVDWPTSLVAEQGYARAQLGIAIAVLLVPAILATIGAITWHWYPLDRATLAEVHAKLEVVHRQKKADRLAGDGTSKYAR